MTGILLKPQVKSSGNFSFLVLPASWDLPLLIPMLSVKGVKAKGDTETQNRDFDAKPPKLEHHVHKASDLDPD